MRFSSLAAVLLLAGCAPHAASRSDAPLPATSPSAVAAEVISALAARQPERVIARFDSTSVARFGAQQREFAVAALGGDSETTAGLLALFEVRSPAELQGLSDATITARLLRRLYNNSSAKPRIVGEVIENGDMAHVVVRGLAPSADDQVGQVELLTLVRRGDAWRPLVAGVVLHPSRSTGFALPLD